MARIPDVFIQDVLARTDVISIVSQYVPGLKKSGSSYLGLCPFHEEKTPSFSVNPEKNLYYCFGCGAGGNVIGFLMRKSGMAYIDVVRELAQQAGLDLPEDSAGIDPRQEEKRQQVYHVLERACQWYQQQLQSDVGKAARDYLRQRGIDKAVARRFELGFAPSGWDSLRTALNVSEELLLAAGLVKRSEHANRRSYDVFRNRLMFPIRSHVRGRVVAFGGRVLAADDKPKYINSPESFVFLKRREWYGLHAQKTASPRPERIFVVEGYMDVVAMAAHGITAAVASLGTAVSKEQLQELLRFFSALVFCFDGDSAGRRAAARVLDNMLPLLYSDADIQFMFLPEGEDPDSMVRAGGATALHDGATRVGIIDFLRKNLRGGEKPPASADARARLLATAGASLDSLRDPVIRSVVMANLAEDFSLTPELIERMIQDSPVRRRPPPPESPLANDEASSPLMRQVVVLLLHDPQLILQCREQIEAMPEVKEKKFFSEWLAVVTDNPEISSGAMLEHWRDSRYDKRLQQLAATPVLLKDSVARTKEFVDIMHRLDLDFCRKRTRSLLAGGLSQLGESQLEELRRLRNKIGTGAGGE